MNSGPNIGIGHRRPCEHGMIGAEDNVVLRRVPVCQVETDAVSVIIDYEQDTIETVQICWSSDDNEDPSSSWDNQMKNEEIYDSNNIVEESYRSMEKGDVPRGRAKFMSSIRRSFTLFSKKESVTQQHQQKQQHQKQLPFTTQNGSQRIYNINQQRTSDAESNGNECDSQNVNESMSSLGRRLTSSSLLSAISRRTRTTYSSQEEHSSMVRDGTEQGNGLQVMTSQSVINSTYRAVHGTIAEGQLPSPTDDEFNGELLDGMANAKIEPTQATTQEPTPTDGVSEREFYLYKETLSGSTSAGSTMKPLRQISFEQESSIVKNEYFVQKSFSNNLSVSSSSSRGVLDETMDSAVVMSADKSLRTPPLKIRSAKTSSSHREKVFTLGSCGPEPSPPKVTRVHEHFAPSTSSTINPKTESNPAMCDSLYSSIEKEWASSLLNQLPSLSSYPGRNLAKEQKDAESNISFLADYILTEQHQSDDEGNHGDEENSNNEDNGSQVTRIGTDESRGSSFMVTPTAEESPAIEHASYFNMDHEQTSGDVTGVSLRNHDSSPVSSSWKHFDRQPVSTEKGMLFDVTMSEQSTSEREVLSRSARPYNATLANDKSKRKFINILLSSRSQTKTQVKVIKSTHVNDFSNKNNNISYTLRKEKSENSVATLYGSTAQPPPMSKSHIEGIPPPPSGNGWKKMWIKLGVY